MLAGRAAAKIEAVKTAGLVLKNVGMVFAAPMLGLVYVVLFPFIGFALLMWMAARLRWPGRRTKCGMTN